jgi:lipoate-protein ligase A
MSARVRLLPFHVADGSWNMAADEALLASAAAGSASLRFYAWSSATLSLGYFQPSAPARAFPLLAGLPWLRRPSGGAALVHHHELTYALALPPGTPWQPPRLYWVCSLHGIIRSALTRFGIDSQLCGRERKSGDVLCFLHHTPGDLLLAPAGREGEAPAGPDVDPAEACKIAGSAQRKHRGALLQHGGILLARSPFTPSLPGIAELAGASFAPEALAGALAEEFPRATGWRLGADDWTEGERRTIESVLPRYLSSDWNAKR